MNNKYKSAAMIRDAAKGFMNGNYGRAIGITFIYIGIAYLINIIFSSFNDILLKIFVSAGKTADADLWIKETIFWAIDAVLGIMLAILIIGMNLFYLKVGCKAGTSAGDIFSGFKENFSRSLRIAFMVQGPILLSLAPFSVCGWYLYDNLNNISAVSLNVLYVATIAGVVGGVLAVFFYLSLRMSYFIMHDFSEYSAGEVISACWKKMNGNRWRLFKLEFSLIPYWILGFLTMGVGMLWVYPFIQEAEAQFYLDLMNPEKTNAEHEETV